jgi:hypothetical protein
VLGGSGGHIDGGLRGDLNVLGDGGDLCSGHVSMVLLRCASAVGVREVAVGRIVGTDLVLGGSCAGGGDLGSLLRHYVRIMFMSRAIRENVERSKSGREELRATVSVWGFCCCANALAHVTSLSRH